MVVDRGHRDFQAVETNCIAAVNEENFFGPSAARSCR
jgi:hypothetical protein